VDFVCGFHEKQSDFGVSRAVLGRAENAKEKSRSFWNGFSLAPPVGLEPTPI
jgi:hypothetical protein